MIGDGSTRCLGLLVAIVVIGVFYYAIYRGGRYAWEQLSPIERRRSLRFMLPFLSVTMLGGLLILALGVEPRDYWRVFTWVMVGALVLGFVGGSVLAIWRGYQRK